jgi:hypothetical protein
MSTRRLVSVALLLSGYWSVGLSGLAAAHDAEKLGNVDFPISCGAEAQPGFNRAVAMMHNFWFPQALNAFAEVAKAYPDCSARCLPGSVTARPQ